MTHTQNFYLFVGKNASTGEPHPLTGHMSQYGDIMKFNTLQDRKNFIENYTSPGKLLIPGGKRKMRDYCLGMSVCAFEEYLSDIESE